MIKPFITNTILKEITVIEENRFRISDCSLPVMVTNKLRKNSKKKSSYASTKIEGNPLTERQASEAIDSDPHLHFLKPEQEVRNYFLALNYLDDMLKNNEPISIKLILDVQDIVGKGASKEKIGLRGPMPPGTLFAVYDQTTGAAEYIPPEYTDIPALLEELIDYVNTTDDHPLIVAAVVHYQLVTIHPFEDGNGRTARLISGYVMDLNGYGFNGIGSLEEYFAYDVDEYYNSLQMELPALYYSGRDNPPHPEVWIEYFLRMVKLYSRKVFELSQKTNEENAENSISFLNSKERELLKYILSNNIQEYRPIDLSKALNVTNRTIINRTANLAKNGFITPVLVKERITSYRLSDYSKTYRKDILCLL